MNRKHLPKIEKWTMPETGGWFIDDTNGKGVDMKGDEVYIQCFPIQGYGRLTLHSIEPNGEVNASVRNVGADKNGNTVEYHEFVVLDNWSPAHSKKAGERFIINQLKEAIE